MRGCPRPGGFTYVEVLLAVVILGGAVTSMGYALAQARGVDDAAAADATASYLLQDGIAWARSLPRADADSPTSFGMETGEKALADIDDVDDLDGLVEAPPSDRTGKALDAGWTRTWAVVSADLGDPSLTATKGSTPLLRIRIAVQRDGLEVAADSILLARTP